ncbi:MAG: calcium-binding protein, partial [Ketobacteraceae bacterium]|nr:calcium-binding protein [Ketobacteraceae bacterium]
NDTLEGGNGRDYLYGGNGDDILRGGAGNGDYMAGEAGNDTYLFGLGDGNATVYNYDTNSSNIDVAVFEQATAEDLWFSRNGNHLQITLVGTGDQITVSNWYINANYQLDRIEAGSSVLVNSQVDQLVSAMAAYDVPSGAGDIIPQETRDALQPVLADSWQTA